MTTASPRCADLVADGGLDLELAAGLQAEVDLVAHRAGDPAVLGDARDRGKAHAGGAADDVEDGRNRVDAADRVDVVLEVVRHAAGRSQREAAR